MSFSKPVQELQAAPSRIRLTRAQQKILKQRGKRLLTEVKEAASRSRPSRHVDADENDSFIAGHTPGGTRNTYSTYQEQWAIYTEERGLPALPAEPDLLMAFMRKMIKDGYARSTITKVVPAAINDLHREKGLKSPTEDPRFKLLKRRVIRATAPPKTKNPVTPAMLVQLALRVQADSFIEVRDMFLFMLMFKVMARQSEAMHLLYTDIDAVMVEGKRVLRVFFATHEPTKTDPERRGDCILVEESENPLTCLVAWYRLYLNLRGQHKSEYLFVRATGDDSAPRRLALSFPNARLKIRCREAGIDEAQYSSHSLRHGGATAASIGGVIERLIKAHGRWKSDCVRVYIHDSLQTKLSVSRAMSF